MTAEIVSIGDELLIGQVINTNASWIGEKLTEASITVRRVTIVGDNDSNILEAFRSAFSHNDIIIVTGGLGPTHDDITRDCVATFFDTSLVLNILVLNDIKERFARFNRPVTKLNEDQALVPECAQIIRNMNGTAPGYWINKENKVFIVMPGVPREMKAMMEDFVLPGLKELKRDDTHYLKQANILTTGIPESTLFEKLGNLDELLEGAKLAFLPNYLGVRLRITVSGQEENEVADRLNEIEQKIRSRVGRYIYGKDAETLSGVVGRLLKERNLRISVAESCTGGNIANEITNHSGSSDYFERGVVAYSNAAKVEILNVDEDTLLEYGAVSKQTVEEMARGIRAISGSDIGLAISGILGPTGATNEKPVGTVYVGYADSGQVFSKEFHFGDDRLVNKQRATQAALELLRRALLGISFEP
ncbi:MAG: competence/damage-inducible protein A [Ignavibacteriaceae bacterium]|nr:competence/damage-inducible protein A [Ignavibacteriaceae bacterium]